MRQIFFLFIIIFLTFGHTVKALSSLDRFAISHCSSDCNGETNLNCRDCTSQAVSLFDQHDPVSPEVNFKINNGKLEFGF